MEMKKFMVMILIGLGCIGLLQAAEVISVDINNYGNDVAYSGQAAVTGATEWIVYYGGWGRPLGSPRSNNLVGTTDDPTPSTYAEQVWVGDFGNHDYVTGAGNGLLDDGFVSNTAADPNLLFIGSDSFMSVIGQEHAYSGTYDIYVYGNSAGSFSLVDANDIEIASASVTGTGTPGLFELGANYVVFEDIPIARPGSVALVYSNELNGIQLVSNQGPIAVIASTDPNDNLINAPDYDVAYDTNNRDGENTLYGPDISDDEVFYLDQGEYMEYDLFVDAPEQGQYDLSIEVNTAQGNVTLDIYLDENLIGSLSQDQTGPAIMGPLPINLLAGTHVLRWQNVVDDSGANIDDLFLVHTGPVEIDDCAEVYQYGLNYPGDLTGDCQVNLADLALFFADWAACYDPESELCD